MERQGSSSVKKSAVVKQRGRPARKPDRSVQRQAKQGSSRSRSREERNERSVSRSSRSSYSQQNFPQNENQSELQENITLNTNDEFADAIRVVFIQFFSNSGFSKGFVFSNEERKKMINEEKKLLKRDSNYEAIEWNPENTWKESQQIEKIQPLFGNTQQVVDSEIISDFKDIFLKASYMFASEVTTELYQILFKVLLIRLAQDREEEIQSVDRLREEIRKGIGFKFFSFLFSSFFKMTLSEAKQKTLYSNLLTGLLSVLKKKST